MAIKDWPGGVISKTPVVPAGTNANSSASGVWTLEQVAYWQKQGIWPNPANIADPYYEYVSLLLTGDGTNGAQNNTFVDSSTNNFTITRNGNTTQGTFSPYGNLWSNYFDGSGDSLTFGTTSSFNFMHNTSGLFTFECWVYRTVNTGDLQFLFDNEGAGTASNVGTGIWVNADGTVVLAIYRGVNGTSCVGAASTTATTLNSWNHVAITWDYSAASDNCKFYINGVFSNAVTKTNTASNSNATYAPSIGKSNNATYTYYYNGYISNMRIVNSIVYTSNFTPSTTPLTAVSGTSLLTCQSNRFKDNSSNNFTLTVNGNTAVQRFSPFNPTAPYDAATIGGSGYFDGSGDYLSVNYNSAFAFNADFTVEFYVNYSAHAQYGGMVCCANSGGSLSNGWNIIFNSTSDNILIELQGGTTITSSIALPKNSWNHVALVRNGSSIVLYMNGANVGSATSSSTFDSVSYPLIVGAERTLSYTTTGYISNLRIVKGTAVYTSTFTPPTAPLTAITNTSLLLNFTNAGIPDAAMMNDLETVGNAQVSTSVKKYGTGSLAFDGNGDYITAPTSPNLGIGSGNFTIEFWLYANTVSGYQTVLDLRTSQPSAGPSIYFANNSRLNYLFNSGTAYAFGPNPLLANTWYHVAWVRSGTTHTLYVDGQSQATFTDSAGLTSSPLAIGARQAGGYADYFNGYIDDLRITKGYARYTANFTPPTAALPTF